MNEAGVLVVDKTTGVTSFDAVALVRRRLGLKRVGHAGTLDPGASGVLPMLLGEATKLMAYLAAQDKEYVATLRLGVTTDTGDLSGRVLAQAPVPELERTQVEAVCRPFVGPIKQVPPMYSAVHHGGRRLYELAREGIEVVREPRAVVIHAIEVQEVAHALRFGGQVGRILRGHLRLQGHAPADLAAQGLQALDLQRVVGEEAY